MLAREGVEPVLQFTMRDRNRLALEADVLGAAALGVPNILCLRGDDMTGGDQPDAKMVHDLDSHELIALARGMRDDAALPSGRAVTAPPALFIGGADAPLDPPPDWRPDKLNAKIDAGADFFQTQPVSWAPREPLATTCGASKFPRRSWRASRTRPTNGPRAARSVSN